MRVVGHRFSKRPHDLRDFLARNRVPARWLDVERDGEARELLTVAGVERRRPAGRPARGRHGARAPDGARAGRAPRRRGPARRPTTTTSSSSAAARPAWPPPSTAPRRACGRVMVEREAPGGQAGQSSRIENYLGFPTGLSGSDLAAARDRPGPPPRRRAAHAPGRDRAARRGRRAPGRALRRRRRCSANCVLVASGVAYRQLDAPGFERAHRRRRLLRRRADRGARRAQDQHVVVIGGANSAGQAAVYFSGYASRVTMLVRGDVAGASSMSHYLIEQIAALPNVEVRTGSEAVAAEGDDGRLRALTIRGPDGEEQRRGGRRVLRVHRRRAAHRLARRASSPATRAASSSPGPTRAARGWPLRARPVPAGDERARRVRRRRRARAVDQARGQRRGGGLDGGVAHPRVPGRGMTATTVDRRRPAPGRPVRRARRRAARALGRGRRARATSGRATCIHEQGGAPRGLLLLLEGTAETVLATRRPRRARRPPARADLDGRDRGAHRGPAPRPHARRDRRAASRSCRRDDFIDARARAPAGAPARHAPGRARS